MLVVGISLQECFDLLDGIFGVRLVKIVFGTCLVDGLDATEEGVFRAVCIGVAAHVVAEVESGHVVVAVLVVGVGKEVEDRVGAGRTKGERVKFFEETGGGEPLLVVVILQSTFIVLVESLERDAFVAHTGDGFLLGGFCGVFLGHRLRSVHRHAHFLQIVRKRSARIRRIRIHHEG